MASVLRRPPMLGHPFRIACSVLKFIAAAHLFWEYGYHVAPAAGPSMLPTLEIDNEWALISKRHRYGRGVGVGDIVVYKIPVEKDSDAIKRVIGMPGDYVLVGSPVSGSDAMMQVPQGHCWLIGDNLNASRDSRMLGPIPLALVKGKCIGSFSGGSFRWFENPFTSQRLEV